MKLINFLIKIYNWWNRDKDYELVLYTIWPKELKTNKGNNEKT